MFFNEYPYRNLTDLNLDFLLKAIGEMQNEVKNFVTLNAVKYADPIQWNITTQYEKNTIVIDPLTGTAYISVQPVPSGVALNRTEYWTPVFDLSRFITQANENFTSRVESEGVIYSTFALNVGDWVIWNGALYKALVNMPIGTAYSVGSNIERITVEEFIVALNDAINNEIADRASADLTLQGNIDAEALARQNVDGDLNNLTTTDKSNLVAAINEVNSTGGNLNDLTTTDKSNLVAAINEVNSTGGGAIGMIGDLDDLVTTDKSNVVSAINEVVNNIPKFKYVVTDYGILPNTGDIYSELYDFLHDVVEPNGGGIVYFPAGTYTLSYTILIPSNTIFTGCGPATKIVFNEADAWVGVALANGGSNIKICNMTVNTMTTGALDFLGANVGSIGVSTMGFAAAKNSHTIPQQNNKNIIIEDIWCDTNYVVQTEPEQNHEVTNVIYRNIHCPNGCVSVGLDGSYDCAISMENIYCDTFRCGMGGGLGDVVAKDINCKYAHIGVWRFICDGLTIRKSSAPNATNIHTSALYIEKGNTSLNTTISITNAFVFNSLNDAAEHACIIGTDIEKALFTNCIFYAINGRAYYITGGAPKPLFINCDMVGGSTSNVYGTALGCSYSPALGNKLKTLDSNSIAHTLGTYNGSSIPWYDQSGTLLGYIPLYS